MAGKKFKKAHRQLREIQARTTFEQIEAIDKWKELAYRQRETIQQLEEQLSYWREVALQND
jgi:hypothetical protein